MTDEKKTTTMKTVVTTKLQVNRTKRMKQQSKFYFQKY